jgi:hypothetical protein
MDQVQSDIYEEDSFIFTFIHSHAFYYVFIGHVYF